MNPNPIWKRCRTALPAESRGASWSDCRKYRYLLWRFWSHEPAANFLMLNPSTADEHTNDPTVERCERRARAMGYGGLIVTNLFAWRATDPGAMLTASDPVGSKNDFAILDAAQWCGLVVCAWGQHGAHRGRSAHVVKLLRSQGVRLYYLRMTRSGEPRHPLYIGYDVEPRLWRERGA